MPDPEWGLVRCCCPCRGDERVWHECPCKTLGGTERVKQATGIQIAGVLETLASGSQGACKQGDRESQKLSKTCCKNVSFIFAMYLHCQSELCKLVCMTEGLMVTRLKSLRNTVPPTNARPVLGPKVFHKSRNSSGEFAHERRPIGFGLGGTSNKTK